MKFVKDRMGEMIWFAERGHIGWSFDGAIKAKLALSCYLVAVAKVVTWRFAWVASM